jgi:hypothetical protein
MADVLIQDASFHGHEQPAGLFIAVFGFCIIVLMIWIPVFFSYRMIICTGDEMLWIPTGLQAGYRIPGTG